jgi:hypothetical protein
LGKFERERVDAACSVAGESSDTPTGFQIPHSERVVHRSGNSTQPVRAHRYAHESEWPARSARERQTVLVSLSRQRQFDVQDIPGMI